MVVIQIYVTERDQKYNKVIDWLEEHKLPYKVNNFNQVTFTRKTYRTILEHTTDGLYDIVTKRPQIYKTLNQKDQIEDMRISEFYKVLIEHPELLKSPLMIDDLGRISTGFKEDDISIFLTKKQRSKDKYQKGFEKLLNKK